MKNPEEIPEWLAKGITYLLPKVRQTNNAKKYKPITCLSTTYHLLISIVTERTYIQGSYGCKEQLLINRMVIENCHKKKRSISTAWIDYRKAFNSVPHSWILKALSSPVIINFLKNSMKL